MCAYVCVCARVCVGSNFGVRECVCVRARACVGSNSRLGGREISRRVDMHPAQFRVLRILCVLMATMHFSVCGCVRACVSVRAGVCVRETESERESFADPLRPMATMHFSARARARACL